MNLINLEKLENNLYRHLMPLLPKHPIAEVYEYAVFPPGKLFRPQLVQAIAFDFATDKQLVMLKKWDDSTPHAYLASLVEIHHAYTLVHDDLPEMDNDEIRRGKPATHVKYGQWQALLTGDGLLNISYQLTRNFPSSKLPTLIALIGHFLGPKGLIHGQVLDLSEEMTNDFETLIQTHKLKTGRLIQLAIIGSYLLLEETKENGPQYRTAINLARLGHAMGITFQLLDDLTELCDQTLNKHELQVNPWFNFNELSKIELIKQLKVIETLRTQYQLENFSHVLTLYYSKILQKIVGNEEQIIQHLKDAKIATFSSNDLEMITRLLNL